jgi:hypothetical protein
MLPNGSWLMSIARTLLATALLLFGAGLNAQAQLDYHGPGRPYCDGAFLESKKALSEYAEFLTDCLKRSGSQWVIPQTTAPASRSPDVIPQNQIGAATAQVKIFASMTEKAMACRSPNDLVLMVQHLKSNPMALINDLTIYYASGKCIDLQQGQAVYIESEPLGNLLCVRPMDKSVCYWAHTNMVLPR